MKQWVIRKDGRFLGTYDIDGADDGSDAVLNWADDFLTAELEEVGADIRLDIELNYLKRSGGETK